MMLPTNVFARCARALAPLATCAALAWPARAEDPVPVTWQGKHFTSAALPDGLGESQRKAVQRWTPWAKKARYRMDFDESGRLLLMTPEKSSRAEAHLKVAARTESWRP